MEEKIRIQDDLFNYVNGEWLEQAVIPDDKPTVGGFADLDTQVEKLLINDFEEMVKNESYPNKYLKDACLLYKQALDTKKRNKLGAKPLFKDLKFIDGLKDISAFNRKLKDLVLDGYPLPFEFFVDSDMKDTIHHAIMLQGPSIILPDTTYYKEGMEAQKEQLLALWSGMVKELLKYTKLEESLYDEYINDAIKFDGIIASLVKSQEEWSDYPGMYNPMKMNKVASLLKPVKIKKLFEGIFGIIPEKVIVCDVRFIKGFKDLFNEETFNLYKHWAYINIITSSTSLLSEELREIGSSYRRALTGVKAIPALNKYAYRLASSTYSEPVGLYYGEKYFGEEAKKDIVGMVNEIVNTYKERIKKNDFLGDETKEKAILKLAKMEVKMGYPDKVNALYDCFIISEENSLYENLCKIAKAKRIYSYNKFSKEVDRTEWVMPGHMVNACYNPFTNDITFPAAILQAPFYSIKQSRSQNLGGIGAVIGHEISHAFDNNGAKCDENGNLNNWWTKEDFKQFTKRTKAMIKEFEGIELPWGKVNASFIVSENIADNGGMGVTIEIMNNTPNASFEEYFMNWGKIWCQKAKDEYRKLLLAVDVHAPVILRANMQPRNFPEWYDTFKVKKTDKMYLAPNKRVTIW